MTKDIDIPFTAADRAAILAGGNVQVKLSPEAEAAILATLEPPMTALECVRNLLAAIDAGNVEVISQHHAAPAAANGETVISFTFRVKWVGSST